MHQIDSFLQLCNPPVVSCKKIRVIGPSPSLVFPYGFFDGVSSKNLGGVGICLYLNVSHHFEFALGVGDNTNTKAELLGLWALLKISHMMGIPLSHIYGDSTVIINWAKGSTDLSPPELFHWCGNTRKLLHCFPDLSLRHIYHEHNQIADRLSKTALSLSPGSGCFSKFTEDHLVTQGTYQLFWSFAWGAYSLFFIIVCTWGTGSGSLSLLLWSLWLTVDMIYLTDPLYDETDDWWDHFLPLFPLVAYDCEVTL